MEKVKKKKKKRYTHKNLYTYMHTDTNKKNIIHNFQKKRKNSIYTKTEHESLKN